MRLILVLLTVFFCMRSQALSEFDVGISVLQHGIARVSKNEKNEKSLLGSTYFNLDFQAHFEVSHDLAISPRLMYMPTFLLPHKASGTDVKSNYLIVELPLVYHLNQRFDASAGVAYINYSVTAPGGTTTLNNGNGTSSFAQADGTVTAKTLGLVLGTSYRFSSFRLSADLLAEGLLSSKKRTFSLIGAASYAFF